MQATRAGHSTLADYLDQGLRRGALWLLLGAALYLTLALASYSPHDLGWSYVGPAVPIANIGGAFGAWFADLALFVLGGLAYLLPPMLAWSGALLFVPRGAEPETRLLALALGWVGFTLTLVASATLLGIRLGDWGQQWLPNGLGGGLGLFGARQTTAALGEAGALGLLTLLLAIGLPLLSGRSPLVLAAGLGALARWPLTKLGLWPWPWPWSHRRNRRRCPRARPQDWIDRDWIVATLTATEHTCALARAATAPRQRRTTDGRRSRAPTPQPKHPPPLHLLAIARPRGEPVALRTLLETPEYRQANAPLTLALGRDAADGPVLVDLARLPHLLATGRDDPALLHALLLGLLYRARPREVRLLLIDSKARPLAVYDDLPHLLAPIVAAPDQAAAALCWCVGEMARRQRLLDRLGAADLATYNQQAALSPARRAATPLPVLAIVVAELAELITAFGNPAIEEPLAHLARRGARAGLHLLLLTRRAANEIVNDAIQADIPARLIADADAPTAAHLRYGPVASLVRLQTAGADEREARQVIAYLRQPGPPPYLADLTATPNAPDVDYLFDEAVRLVVERHDPSIAGVQRALGIGYKRAARLIDEMQRQGILGPPASNGTRALLRVTADEREHA